MPLQDSGRAIDEKSDGASSPAQYVASLRGWQAATVRRLRAAVRASATVEEKIKWGNLVYFSNGPVIVIRAEPRASCSDSGGANGCRRTSRD